jgi:hypothetical protein
VLPARIAALAREASRFGAKVIVRVCSNGTEHVDLFDAPDDLAIQLWDAGYRASRFRTDCWQWCAALVDGERPTTPPGAI